MAVNAPAAFDGTEALKAANRNTHAFYDGRCMNCDCRPFGRVAEWPCGTEPPRVTVDHDDLPAAFAVYAAAGGVA